jgi:Domain of unknown function (DUF222)
VLARGYSSYMCSNLSPAEAPDVAALLAAAPGPAVMAALREVDAAGLSADERLSVVEAWEKQSSWVAAQGASALVSFVGRRPVDGDDFVREDVRAALHLSRFAAEERIDVARALHTHLSATRAALEAGELGYRHAVTLVDGVRDAEPGVRQAVEAAVLERGRTQTLGEFRRSIDKAKAAADPQTFAEQRAAASPDQALGVDARRADALVALCAAALADPNLPRRHARPAQVQVVTDLPTLLHLADHPGDLLGYGPIPAARPRRRRRRRRSHKRQRPPPRRALTLR